MTTAMADNGDGDAGAGAGAGRDEGDCCVGDGDNGDDAAALLLIAAMRNGPADEEEGVGRSADRPCGYWNYAYLPRQLVVTVVSTALLVWTLRIMPTCGTSDSGFQV